MIVVRVDVCLLRARCTEASYKTELLQGVFHDHMSGCFIGEVQRTPGGGPSMRGYKTPDFTSHADRIHMGMRNIK